MYPHLNSTHDPARTSWVESANDPSGDFPLQNLPYGVFLRKGEEFTRLGVAIGDRILDLRAADDGNLLPASAAFACHDTALNTLMAAGAPVWSDLRARLSELLGADSCPSGERRNAVERCLVPMADAELLLPARIGDYTAFYASIVHAATVGSMFRPDNPLLPNYKWMPIGYHGRASSVVPSGTPVRRPSGQLKPADAPTPLFEPCKALDYELELGAFVGPGNPLGEPIPISSASRHCFGLCLLNDWSARDIQSWEYQPLGPFLSKNFATTLSPWVVTFEALAPFRNPAVARVAGDPAPLPHLTDRADQEHGGVDLFLEVLLLTAKMRASGAAPHRISSGNFKSMYWTFAQILAHHTSNGCNLQPGDLLGSGTVSGPGRDERGCLLELAQRGKDPVALPNGEKRAFLEPGDEVILRGFCERVGFRRIGLGECRGVVFG